MSGLRAAARLLFWLTLAFVAFATLSPIALRPETPFGPDAERFAAFALAGLLAALGYPRHRFACFVGLVAAAGLLEVAQHLVLGRHGRVHDFAIKTLGAAAGAGLAAFLTERALGRAPR